MDAFSRLAKQCSEATAFDLFESFELAVKVDPYALGERHPQYDFWLFEMEGVARLPRVVFVYTIDVEHGIIVAEHIQKLS